MCLVARALDPERRYSQYLRHQWTQSNGFPGGRINSITETSDGYLWLATSKGLVRFDGVSFISIGNSIDSTRPISQALTLVSDSAGALWVSDENLYVRRYDHGRFQDLTSLSNMERTPMPAISNSNDGGLLVASMGPQVFEFRNGKMQGITGQSNLEMPIPQAMAETSDGKIWIATYEAGLFYWDHGRLAHFDEGLPDSKINCLLPVERGGLWIGTDNGLVLWDGKKISTVISASSLRHARVLSLARDRDANLWIGTSSGLFRLSSVGLSPMDAAQTKSTRTVTAIFEDRQGDLWIGDSQGLERLRDGTFSTYSVADGLPAAIDGPVYVDSSNRALVAPSSGGLYVITNSAVVPALRRELGQDVIYSIGGSQDDLWLGLREGGLMHVVKSVEGELIVANRYSQSQGLAQNSVSSVFRSRDGTIWAGTVSGGVSRLNGGRFVTYTSSDGLGSNTVTSIAEGSDGSMWFATSDGLSRFWGGTWKTFRTHDGLPSDEITTLFRDSSGVLWVATVEGLAYMAAGAIHPVFSASPSLREPALGIVEDAAGFMWLTTASHVIRVSRAGLLKGDFGLQNYREYGDEDGLKGTSGVRRDRSVMSEDGQHIWFSTTNGISMVDLHQMRDNPPPAQPKVESIVSDGKLTALNGPIKISAAPQRISISYIAVDLAMPERVRYRYKLEGFDHTWSDPVDTRQVVYTNLGPGTYQFDIAASNGDGVWNPAVTNVQFTIQPTVQQTWWFRTVMGAAAACIFWMFYMYRLKLATERIQERLDARLEERDRIARELHDTLLQGFQGLMLRLHALLKTLPPDGSAHDTIERLLDRADQVLLEGRESVQDLRQTDGLGSELSEVLVQCGEEFAGDAPVDFSVVIVGPKRTLRSIVLIETIRIGREALFNCFQHAQASKIEVEVTYLSGQVNLRIRDDGVGIDARTLEAGRSGHFGLSGMRERARKIGAKLNIWTDLGAGTEIELTIPAKVAYPRSRGRSVWRSIRGRDAA
jgi:signal transduction histidine kinase/ligand-binding sensor domain-containing protein